MFNKTLNRKILFLMFITAILPIGIISLANMVINQQGYSELVYEQQELIEGSVNSQLETAASDLLRISEFYATDDEVLEAYISNDRGEMREATEETFRRLAAEHHFEIFEVGDVNGHVFYRAHNPDQYGDDKSDTPAIQAALNGESTAGFEIGSSGLNIRAFLPLELDGEIIGTLQTGVNDAFLQEIIANLEGVAIQLNDMDGQPLAMSETESLTAVDQNTLEEVTKGEIIVNEQGNFLNTYIPMLEPMQQEMIGFIHISQDISDVNHVMDQNKWIALLIMAVAFILVAIIAVYFGRSISVPVQQAAELMNDISNGNLRHEAVHYKGKDEVKVLVDAVNKMQDSLREMIEKVSSASSDVFKRSDELNLSAAEAREGSEQIAATMEEMASGSEVQVENASDVQKFMESFTEKIMHVNESSSDITNKSNNVLVLTEEGSRLMEGSVAQMNKIDHVMQDSITKVKMLEEESKAIHQIVEVIYDIADQTNLLSLNAAIEAARAGEQGKGFAVVASEVGKLAEQVADSIQEITQIVERIQEGTGTVVQTLHSGYEEVGEGTKQIEATGTKFETINEAIQDVALNLRSISTNLNDVSNNSQDMNSSLEEITAVTEQASAGIQQTTAATQQSTSSMEEITRNATELAELAKQLTDHIAKFKL